MTKQEKRQYRRAIQTARNAEAQQQIRELIYTKLAQRAKERGMFVANHGVQLAPHETAPLHKLGGREPMRIEPNHPIRNGAISSLHPIVPHAIHPIHPIHLPPHH